jgi:hypothetical protein
VVNTKIKVAARVNFKAVLFFLMKEIENARRIKYNKSVFTIEIDNPFHKEKGMELMTRTEWFNSQIEHHTNLPRYSAAAGMKEIDTTAIQPQSATVDNGIATIFDNKNNKGN